MHLAHDLAALGLVLLAGLVCAGASVRLGGGPVLGYLLAGVLVGPALFDLFAVTPLVHALAEFGVVFLLFAIGLELPLARVRSIGLRPLVIGILQVGLTMAAVFAVAVALGRPWSEGLVLAMALSLSSTAVVLRLLADRGELATRHGRTAFAVLILQDLAVGPMLVALLVLAGAEGEGGGALAGILKPLLAGGLLIAVVLSFARRPVEWLYGRVAALGLDELVVGTTLLLALVFALAAELAGLSLAFGGLLAGMVLAETAYRHRVAADIRAFRGLLVGLFFLTVGMQLDLARALAAWPLTLGVALGLYLGKGLLVAALARLFGHDLRRALHLGVLLGQGGEFAFVLFAAAGAAGLVAPEVAAPVSLAVAVGMAATPLLVGLLPAPGGGEERADGALPSAEAEVEHGGHVVVAGAGSVGRQVAQSLRERGIPVVGLDVDPGRVAAARRRGLPFYYGDVTHPDVLDDVRIDLAAAVVLALDGPRRTRHVMAFLRYLFPDKPVLVRAHVEEEVEDYLSLGAAVVVPEVVQTGRHIADAILRLLPERVPPAAEQAEDGAKERDTGKPDEGAAAPETGTSRKVQPASSSSPDSSAFTSAPSQA